MKYILLLSTTLLLASCASAPKSERAPASVATANLPTSESYLKGLGTSSITGFEKAECSISPTIYEKQNWKTLVKEGSACVAAGRWANVEAVGAELAKREVNAPWGPYFLSVKSEHDGNNERALWMAELSLKRAPESALINYHRARILWKKEFYKESLLGFTKTLQLDTNIIDAHLFLGQIYFRDQDFDKAAQHFQAVLKVRPKDPTALMGLAECHIQLTDARSALEYLEKATRYYTSEASFVVRQAQVYEYMLNDVPKALELYTNLQSGYEKGLYTRQLDFSLKQKILDLQMSVRGQRAVASGSGGVAK